MEDYSSVQLIMTHLFKYLLYWQCKCFDHMCMIKTLIYSTESYHNGEMAIKFWKLKFSHLHNVKLACSFIKYSALIIN